MLNRISLSVLTIAGFFLLAAGCNNVVRPPIEPHADPYAARQIHLDSYELQRDMVVGDPTRSRDDAGILHIAIPIRSVIDRQLYVQYKVLFFDRNHNEVNRIGWTDKTLTANTPDQITANSTSASADDFQVSFRYPPGY